MQDFKCASSACLSMNILSPSADKGS